ncbi:hypothetical protein F4556_005280 [Kitasatospora gansuensis]|uniref:PKD domain-containing protein n=1 Tax=Kitasatospora gansuensis TaxID=258050 RepID=A0A7W7SFX6_9ACTN|nr:right-handed parallel beta-helix repeat-containing protein [Kitasatospora gansuensis]MBB4949745.1 hypothetical protein [Kitasatospora gansuensis]
MSRRRLTLTAGLLTAVSLLIPGPAQAADAPPSGIGQQIDTAALNAAKAAGLETFSSPAEKSYRIPRATGQGELNSRQTTAGRTIWAAATYCGAEVGAGTEASPYCKLQSAVDAAVPGDTVRVKSWTNSTGAWEAATVRTSGITIIGEGDPEFAAVNQYAGRPALTLDGVTDVTVRNLVLTAGSAPAVRITKSARVTLDGSYASSWESSGVTIDGASSDITVSRTYVNTGRWTPGVPGIAVASGATRITLAADALAASGIVADGVHGLDIAGNTIQRGCSPAVDVTGDSTAVNVQNNVILDANPVTDSSLGGFKENCAEHQPAQPWDPSVRIAAPASAGTSLDYNTFHLQDGYGTLPISVSGAPYTGAHDNLDPTLGGATGVRKDKYGAINLALVKGSTAIGTANPAAPGQLASDFYGTTPRVSRGAAEYLGTDPTLAVALTAKLTTGRAVQVTPAVTSSRTWVPVYLDWGDGTTTYVSPNGTPVTPHTYAKPGSYTVTATAVIETGDQVANSVKITTLGSHYTAYGPTRLLDTRTGLGAAAVKVAPYSSVKVKVAGGALPTSVTAAVLNITVTEAVNGGFITAYASGKDRPSTSNVNFTAGQTVPNLTVTPVGSDGQVELFNGSGGPVHLIADIAGYFTRSASSGYTATAPGRLVDTREGTGTARGQIAGKSSFSVQIAGNPTGPLPGSGITAVALNVTTVGSRGAGYLTVYPSGGQTPVASNLNFGQGQVVANSVITPVGADGKIEIYNGSGAPTDVVVDVVGYYSPDGASSYRPVTPTRLLDTRSWGKGALARDNYIYMPLGAGYPEETGYVMNATVTEPVGAGFLTVAPDPNALGHYQSNVAVWPTRPLVSALNWKSGETVPNLVQATPGPYGVIDFWNGGGGNIHLVVDVFGYYDNS